MLTYFRGYNFVDDNGKGDCECAPCDPGPFSDYKRSQYLGRNDWVRVASWFALFNELEFVTKDDTVYTYLCSKGLYDLDPYNWYGWNKDLPLYKVRSRWRCNDDEDDGVTQVSHIGQSPSNASDLVDIKFPKELIKMADNYRVGRTIEFIDHLINVVCYSEIGASIYLGAQFPRAVITAVEGFNPVVSSLNSIVENCKALYASVIPSVRGEPYCRRTKCGTESFLKYDPSRNGAFNDINGDARIVGTSFIKCHRYIIELLRDRLREDMLKAVSEHDIATCNQVREAINAVIGVLVYIFSCATENNYRWIAFTETGYESTINMFRLKESADKKAIFGECYGSDKCPSNDLASVFMGASPDAALCVGSIVGGRYGSNSYRMMRFAEYLSNKRAVPSLVVGAFLRNEISFQERQMHEASERIRRFREGAGK